MCLQGGANPGWHLPSQRVERAKNTLKKSVCMICALEGVRTLVGTCTRRGLRGQKKYAQKERMHDVCPQGGSNPCFGLERATSWATRRWGRGDAQILSWHSLDCQSKCQPLNVDCVRVVCLVLYLTSLFKHAIIQCTCIHFFHSLFFNILFIQEWT